MALGIAWLMYFEGVRMANWVERIANRIENGLGPLLLQRAVVTVRAVMLGLVGSAMGQALAMAIGLAIAGVPTLGILTAATFFLSLVPGGPAVIWGGAAIWLYSQKQPGLAIFMLAWGVVVVSSVDNILKPILMSKGTDQSLLLVMIGVFGGALAFGFVGLFLGPIILGVVATLLDVWLEQVEEPKAFEREKQKAELEFNEGAGLSPSPEKL
jgi:predicted PurR-regulated permease PerM